MGKSHAQCGLTVGVLFAGVLDHAPLLVRLLVIPVVGGAALLPDIDKPGSRIARSLGFVTMGVARVVAAVSEAVYDATRTPLDKPMSNGGHRKLTHTGVGALGFGLMTLAAVWSHPVAGAAVLALMTGLPIGLFRGSLNRGAKSLGVRVKHLGVGLTLGSGGLAWWTLTHDQGWWWVGPVAVTLGVMTHIAGDWVTNTGVPHPLFPLTRDGQRWAKVHAPRTFDTGGDFETDELAWILPVGFIAATATVIGFDTGIAQTMIYSAVS